MIGDEAREKIKLALALAVIVAGVRTAYILYERHEANVAFQQHKQAQDAGYSDKDWYVSPKKLHPYDLKSAKQLTQQPVWVREGYTYTYYSCQAGTVDFAHDAGLLGPLEKLQIRDVVVANAPRSGAQVMAVFEKSGRTFAVPIGLEADGAFQFHSDDMFFMEDPHQLYHAWPPEIWQAIDAHQAKLGMKELQVDFALGLGHPDGSTPGDRSIRYANGGQPMVVTFESGKAVKIEPGTAE